MTIVHTHILSILGLSQGGDGAGVGLELLAVPLLGCAGSLLLRLRGTATDATAKIKINRMSKKTKNGSKNKQVWSSTLYYSIIAVLLCIIKYFVYVFFTTIRTPAILPANKPTVESRG